MPENDNVNPTTPAPVNPLIGINLADLLDPAKLAAMGPQALANIASGLSAIANAVQTRQTDLKKTLEAECFGAIAVIAKENMLKMSWEKMPKLILLPTADGTGYTVQYVSTDAKKNKAAGGTGKRTTPDVNSGDITINKIAQASGGIAFFRVAGKDYEGIKETVKALMQKVPKMVKAADGTETPELDANKEPVMVPGTVSESERCWDIVKKGISASDILTKYHADEVTLIFNDKTEKSVAQAVAAMKSARQAMAQAAA